MMPQFDRRPIKPATRPPRAGLASLTEGLAASLEPHGVLAFAVASGIHGHRTDALCPPVAGGDGMVTAAGPARVVDATASGELIGSLAEVGVMRVSGRFLHTLDDVESLVEQIDEVRRLELDALHITRLD